VARSVAVMRSGFRLCGGDPAPATPPTALGADTEDVLTEIGYGAADIATLRRAKAI
jgi:CoA:oxalate CoA-transferase